jgi:hypothetical protein
VTKALTPQFLFFCFFSFDISRSSVLDHLPAKVMNVLYKSFRQKLISSGILVARKQMSSDSQTSLKYSESRFSELKQSLNSVRDEIAQEVKKIGRSVDSVDLVAVSKYMPASDIQALYDLGQRDFGENYVQELTHKAGIVSFIFSMIQFMFLMVILTVSPASKRY